MFCKNCGSLVNDGEGFCPSCGTIMGASDNVSSGRVEIKTTAFLVFSIIELICVNQIFGLISLILYCTKLKPAADAGDVEGANKSKKTIKILLIAGLVLSLVVALAMFGMFALIAIPNFGGMQGRMETRADLTTAAQVGKAVRVWYTEATIEGKYDYERFTESFVRIDELDGFESYADIYIEPSSYGYGEEDGAYYATVTDEGPSGKIVVAIGPENLYSAKDDYGIWDTFYDDIDENVEVTYTGGGSGIAYVEQ